MANYPYQSSVDSYAINYVGPYTWNPEDPITADRANQIEAGIAEALRRVNVNLNSILTLGETVETASENASKASRDAASAAREAQEAKDATADGFKAWTQISAVMYDNAEKSLSVVIDEIKTSLNNATTELQNARIGNSTLADRLLAIDNSEYNSGSMKDRIGKVETSIGNIDNELHYQESLNNRTTLTQKLNAIKEDLIKPLQKEINDTHRSDRVNDELYLRLNDIDSTDLENYPNSIANRLAAIDGGGDATLSNRVAKIEEELGPLNNSRLDQVYSEVGSAHRNEIPGGDTLAKRFENIENSISNLNDSTTGLDERLTAIDDEEDENSLIIRVNNITDEISAAHSQIGVDEETGDPIYGTLSNRFETIESDITNLIGEEGTISDFENRIGALESEIDMTSDNSRIDYLISEVNTNTTNIGLIQTELSTARNGEENLSDRLDNIDDRITALGNIDISDITTTVVVDDAIFDEEDGTPILPNEEEPNENVDYLIKKEDKYYYWKYINNTWELISGGGEGTDTGTSSAIILEELPNTANADENIDYYIGNNQAGYTHYRYIPSEVEGEYGEFITILPTKLTDNLNNLLNHAEVLSVNKTDQYSENDAWPTNDTFSGGPAVYAINDTEHENNLLNDFVAVRNTRINTVYEDEVLKSQTLQVIDTKGHLIEYPIVGGGGGGSAYSIRLLSTLNNNTFTVPSDSSYITYIGAKATVKQGNTELEGVTFSGRVLYRLSTESNWRTSNIIIPNIQNGQEFTVDVSSVLTADSTTIVRLSVDINTGDGDSVNRTLDYTITKTQISISSTFNPASILSSANLDIKYTCFGINLPKVVHFEIDGVDVATESTSSHKQELTKRLVLAGLSNGSHTLSIYFTTSGNVTSNKLNYYIIYNTDTTRIEPIIGINAVNESITYGEELIVNYTAYTPNKEKTEKIEIKLYTLNDQNEQVIYNDHIDVLTDIPIAASTWKTTSYPEPQEPANEEDTEHPITAYIEMKAYNTITELNDNNEPIEVVYTDTRTTSVIINRFTNPNNYDFTEVATDNLLYDYTAYGKTNNDIDRANYKYVYTANDQNATELTFNGNFEGFNWATNGYVDGESLTISGGAIHTINVPVFQTSYNGTSIESLPSDNDEITRYGRTIEIEYEVQSATDLNATIIDCMDSNPDVTAGFRITPNCCYLTNKTTGVELDDDGFILNESSIAAAYLQTGTRIHLVFVIEPWSNTRAFDNKFHQSVNIYINGEFANSCPYDRDSEGRVIDDFTTDAVMRFGSNTCILKVYGVKIYNYGLTHEQVLQRYKLSPPLLYDKLVRFAANDLLEHGVVSYEKAKKHYNCLLLKGPDPTNPNTLDWPTISPFKGSPSPAKRKKKASSTSYEGKTESGLILTKPSSNPEDENGYKVEFSLLDKLPNDAPEYFGAKGAYISSNNVQGTSSQKYPIHNLKIYLAKWSPEKTSTSWVALEENEEVPEGTITKTITYKQVPKEEGEGYDLVELEEGEDTTGLTLEEITYKQVTTVTEAPSIKKVKYSILGYDDDGNPLGTEESTLCWKADYMSTDHANTYNANIADKLFSDKLLSNWDTKKYQNTVRGIRCLLFQQQGDNAEPVFVADGCLNNDKGNAKTYGLEDDNDDGNDTLHQKWEFTNNTSPLDVFKSDNLIGVNEKDSNKKIYAKGAFECNYPDEGDLKDAGIEPNYNHLQLLLTWINKRACYLDYSIYDEDAGTQVNHTVSDVYGSGGIYNGINYDTERELKKAIFKNEFERHFNLNHVLTYYIFSEYVALCDNRAKNMFIRTEDIRSEVIKNPDGQVILNGNEFPEDDPTGLRWAAYVDPSTGETNVDAVDWSSESNFCVWAPVLYDLDSCFGVENVGLITIKYNADWQYAYNNKQAFSGYDSLFWLMVEDTYDAEIRTLAKDLYNNELNFTNFYRQQIIDNNNATCPAVTNQDMILKFQKPWNEGFINYAEDPDPVTGEYPTQTPEYKYIQRGTRTTQKATFMRQRSMLLSSKYVSNEFTNSMISFRAGVLVTGQNTLLTLVANQDLYPAIMFGDSNTLVRPTHKVINGVAVEITDDNLIPATVPCEITTDQIGNSDTVKIVGALVLTDIGDISKYQPYELKVGSGTNLKRLIIGSDAEGYTNSSTEGIEGLANCALLEEINIRNTTKMGSLNLGSNGLIKKVYAKGSNATTISLPNGGVLEEVEYGAKTTNITLLNQSFFRTFTHEDETYSNLTKLWVENTPNVPITEILMARLDKLTAGIRLVGINLELEDSTLLEMLASDDLIKGKHLNSNGSLDSNINNPPHITGTIKVPNIRQSLLNKLNTLYPNLIVNSVNAPMQEFSLTYKNVDANGNETTLLTLYRTAGETIPDPVLDTDNITGKYYIQSSPAVQIGYDGKQYVPLRTEDAEYKYKFGLYNTSGIYQRYSGWVIKENSNTRPTASTSITKPLTLLATYPNESRIKQKYTVTWYDDDNTVLLSIPDIEYGTDASVLTPPSKNNPINPLITKKITNGMYKVFRGWDRPVSIVKGDINVHSLWYESNGDFSEFNAINDLNPAALYALTRLDTSTRNSLLYSHVGKDVKYIQLGHDFEYSPEYIETIDLIPNQGDYLYFDGTVENVKVYNGADGNEEIYPLLNLNQDFTFAIDFKFLMDSDHWASSSTQEYVLASCFRNSDGVMNGFRLSIYKSDMTYPEIRLYWGNNTVSQYRILDHGWFTLDDSNHNNDVYRTYRNMLVLRHVGSNPNTLYVYYASPANEPKFYSTTGVISDTIEWASTATIEAPLVLGGTLDSSGSIEMTNIRSAAQGVIYYAKYWHEDLGHSNCLELASWPHETIAYKISGYYDGLPSTDSSSQLILGNSSTNTINLTPAQALGDRNYNYALSGDNAFEGSNSTLINGWSNAHVHSYLNNTVYNAFPTAYQSLIEKITINAITQQASDTSNNPTMTSNPVEVEDFIYLPSYYELQPSNLPAGSPYRIEAIHPWAWLDVDNITNVFTLDSQNRFIHEDNITILNYLRFMFFRRPVTPDCKIFHMSSTNNPYLGTYYYNNQRVIVNPGDIWYDGSIAYMYVSEEDVRLGIEIDKTKPAGSGGWAPATIWATRTYNYTENTRRYAYSFMKVLYNGSISTTETPYDKTTTRALIPQFSI